jgi:hypothetical protein
VRHRSKSTYSRQRPKLRPRRPERSSRATAPVATPGRSEGPPLQPLGTRWKVISRSPKVEARAACLAESLSPLPGMWLDPIPSLR